MAMDCNRDCDTTFDKFINILYMPCSDIPYLKKASLVVLFSAISPLENCWLDCSADRCVLQDRA
jgi:hypothetical protein